MILVVIALVSALLGAGLVAGVAYTSRAVERSVHKREVTMLANLLDIERSRTGDLLTRLAARNLNEYRAIVVPDEPSTPRPTRITDATGLIEVDADDESNVV